MGLTIPKIPYVYTLQHAAVSTPTIQSHPTYLDQMDEDRTPHFKDTEIVDYPVNFIQK